MAVATSTYRHTDQTSWERVLAAQADLFDKAATTLSDPGDYAFADTLWTTDLTGTPELAVITTTSENSSIAFKFYGTGGDNKTGEARLWGVSKLSTTEFMGDFLCELSLTTGAKTVTGGAGSGESDILPTCNLVDTITVAVDHTDLPGVRVVGGAGDDGVALVVLDGFGYKYFILEIGTGATDGATGLGALYRTL